MRKLLWLAVALLCVGVMGCVGEDGEDGVGLVGAQGLPGDKGQAGVGIPGGVGPQGPKGDDGHDGLDGRDGEDSNPCTVFDNADGSYTMACPDGTTVTFGGEDGLSSQVRLDEEPPGDNCPHGGTAIHTGLDDDRDGVLDDEEIEDTQWVCSGGEASGGSGVVVCGSFNEPVSISGQNVELLADCTDILGHVRIGGFDGEDLSGLESIRTIRGNLTIADNHGLRSLRGLDSLTTVMGGLNVFFNPGLVDLSGLENLERVDGHIAISDSAAMTSLDGLRGIQAEGISASNLPLLVDIGGMSGVRAGSVGLIECPLVADLSVLSQMPDIQNITLEGLDSVADLSSLDGIHSLGSLTLRSMPNLTTLGGSSEGIQMRVLALIGNPLLVDLEGVIFHEDSERIAIHDNPALSNINSLGSVIRLSTGLVLDNNDGLTSLSALEGLEVVASLHISNNDNLPACEVDALALRLSSPCACQNNNDEATCD